ncbi:MAG TPA: DUF4252 domain-containing protein [Verrucomicrobiota bacterium]|nr:DUF4252 domain-containing protein [Verrucomicrobiota bacterium]
MKALNLCSLAVAAGLSLAAACAADAPSPGYFDLGSFAPPKSGGEFVEVNLKGNLLRFAAKVAEQQEPDAADLLKSIESVRVNVVGLDESNRGEIKKRIETLAARLQTEGWERIVTVQKDGEDVGVYTKAGSQDSIAGIVVTVVSHEGQAVFVNVVGELKPEKIAELGERLHISPLKQAGEAIEKKP